MDPSLRRYLVTGLAFALGSLGACVAPIPAASPERSSAPDPTAQAPASLEEPGEPELDGLEIGWTTIPTDAASRYDRARELVRDGRLAAAAAELERLLRADLPRFGPRLRDDEALAALRESDPGEALERTRRELAAAYEAAAMTGVRAWIYAPRSDRSPRSEALRASYEDLRLGVYLSEEARFVPLSPELPRALGGHLDRAAGRLLIVSGEIIQGEVWVVQPRDIGVHLYALAELGRPIVEAEQIDRAHEPTRANRYAVSAAIESQGEAVRVTYHDLGYVEGRDRSVLVEAGGLRLLSPTPAPAADERLWIDGRGVRLELPPPAGLRLAGRSLHVDGREQPIPLAHAHDPGYASQQLSRTDDGRFALLLSQEASCAGGDGPWLRFALSRVDLEDGVATLLAEGRRRVGAELGEDGTIYFDDGEQVVRFTPDSSEAIADLPAGVRFLVPGYAFECSV